DHAAPPGYFTELRHMPNEEFLRQYNVNLAQQVAMGSQLRLRFEQEAKLLKKSVAQVARRDKRIQARELEIKNWKCCWRQRRVSNERLSRQVDALQQQHGVEHGHAQRTIESLEAYDPEAEAKFAAALQSLKDLKLSLLDQLEGLKDAPLDVIMASLYLEDDTGGMLHNLYATSVPAPPSLPSRYTQRSDRVPVSAPIVVPQGLALLLVDAATQTDPDDA
nr:hypothetical protein [Tanacetum cinerariifolium]